MVSSTPRRRFDPSMAGTLLLGVALCTAAILGIGLAREPIRTNAASPYLAGDVADSALNVTASTTSETSPNGCGTFPIEVQFESDVSGGVAPFWYLWTFGDGSPNSTGGSPLHAYSAWGKYNVTVEVGDANGTRATSSLTVQLYPPPCPIEENTPFQTPTSVLLGATLVALLACGIGFGLYRWGRRPRA
jgi:hypothetical protein